jgi:hypothetical protein
VPPIVMPPRRRVGLGGFIPVILCLAVIASLAAFVFYDAKATNDHQQCRVYLTLSHPKWPDCRKATKKHPAGILIVR